MFFINTAAFNGLRKPFHAIISHGVRFFVLYIPFAFFFSRLWNLEGVFWGTACSSILAGVFIWWWLRLVVKRAATQMVEEKSV
jgi:Na+-driven multidrug efflux pump